MKQTTEKAFDAVEFARTQKDILGKKLAQMTPKEIVAFFAESRKRIAAERAARTPDVLPAE